LSSEEKKGMLDRLVEQRAKSTRRAILLESELRAAGESLFHVGTLLKNLSSEQGRKDNYVVTLNAVINAPEICGLSRIAAMLVDLQETRELLDELDSLAAGI
jgi:hypothetical protein